MKIAYCTATYNKDFEETKKCIERVSPNVDVTIIVYDQTITDEQFQWLLDNCTKFNIFYVRHEFKDSLPQMRNEYIRKAKELGVDWICVSDPDELYSEELATNLRILITEADAQGYNLLPVPCRDQFDNVGWLDRLDLLKEVPGGYRETEYWKPMLIFKLHPDLRYEGVGAEKNVHETLVTKVPVKSVNLDKKYFYVHKKSALKIWRNAARNMYIGGGGDNVGVLNPLWVQLRTFTAKLGIDTWQQFEDLVNKGIGAYTNNDAVKDVFRQWLVTALQSPPTNYGTETRETAKYYFALHKDEVDEQVEALIKNPPKIDQSISIENFVTRTYLEILGRPPDELGKNIYVNAILEQRITPDQLADVFRNSDEYKQKFGRPFTIKVAGNVGIEISENLARKVKDHKDTSKYNTVALCIMGYHKGMDMIVESIQTIGSVVDEIHIQGDDLGVDDLNVFERTGEKIGKKIQMHIEPWKDDFSDYKNRCIAHATTEWVLILDHDEIPTGEFAKSLKDIILKSDRGNNYDIVGFDVIDVRTLNGKVTSESRNSGGKPLLHWNIPNPYTGNPHIWLKSGYYPWRQVHAGTAYRHVKEVGTDLERSVRNVFMGGGGDNTKQGNPVWVELVETCKEFGLSTWKEFNEYLIKGKIDLKILDVLKKLAEMPWKDNELKDCLRYYLLLHPEEENT